MKRAFLLGVFTLGLAACGGTTSTGSGGSGGGTGATGGTTGSTGTTSTGGATGGGGAGGATGGTGGATGGTGGATGGSGGGTGATGGATGGGGTGGTGGGCGACDWSCCGTTCANTNNDILNCGACGTKCDGPHPYCDNGKCGEPPCNGAQCGPAGLCCGSQCCGTGDLCCDVPGPVEMGPACTKPNENGTCPAGCAKCVCASPDSLIATPSGERPIADLQTGDLVYSVHQGQVVAVPLIEAVHVAAPNHAVVEVTLDNGRTIDMSPRHPTADGRSFASLKAGDSLQGATIASVRVKPFQFAETYDILPDSDTGTYFASGALVGSTLAPSSAQHCGQAAPPALLSSSTR